MKKDKIILGGVAITSLLIGGVAGIFLSSYIDFSNNKDLTSDNKNLVYTDTTYRENEYFKDLDKVFADITQNGRSLISLASANKKKIANKYYNRIAADVDTITHTLSYMVADSKRTNFVVQGNTLTESTSKTLTVYPDDYDCRTFTYSFDGGETWQNSNKKTFTKNQKVEIKVQCDGFPYASQTHEINTIVKDAKAPKITYFWNAKSYKDGHKLPAELKVTCTDALSDIKYLAFDKSKTTYKTKSKSQTESMGFVGSSTTTAPITITCSDSAGNIAKVIVPKHKLYK